MTWLKMWHSFRSCCNIMTCLKCVSFNSASVVPIQMEEFVVVQMHYLLSLWATRLSQRHCTIFILDLPLALLQMSRERSRSRSDGSLRPGDRDGLGPRATDPAAASSPCRWSRHARMQQVVVHSLLIERWTTLEEVKSQLSLIQNRSRHPAGGKHFFKHWQPLDIDGRDRLAFGAGCRGGWRLGSPSRQCWLVVAQPARSGHGGGSSASARLDGGKNVTPVVGNEFCLLGQDTVLSASDEIGSHCMSVVIQYSAEQAMVLGATNRRFLPWKVAGT